LVNVTSVTKAVKACLSLSTCQLSTIIMVASGPDSVAMAKTDMQGTQYLIDLT
jgi:hypothetical protein